jgi:hypothetical protein
VRASILFSFLLFRVFMILWREKKLWKGFRVFHLGFEEAGGSLLF